MSLLYLDYAAVKVRKRLYVTPRRPNSRLDKVRYMFQKIM